MFIVSLSLPAISVEIESQDWISKNIQYTILRNQYTPRFSPKVSIKDLIENALDEYRLPKISLNLTYNSTIRVKSIEKYTSMDGINSISFHPNYTAGSTTFYIKSSDIVEFDMKINSYAYKTSQTLYLTLLHEFGHVFGLNHPLVYSDTIMGRGLFRKLDGEYIQEHTYFSLTKDDVKALYKHEITFTFDEYKKIYINNYLNSLLELYTTTLLDQEL